MSAQFSNFEEGQFSDAEEDDFVFETNQVQTGRGEFVGRNGSTKATMSQKTKTDKAKTNKDNIITKSKAEENTIRKNSE